MTARIRRLAVLVCLTSGLSVAGMLLAIYVTWPANVVGNYLNDRRNREATVRALEWRIGNEADPLERRFYQAWLAEEKRDLKGAIRGFHALREEVPPGTPLHLRSSLRLGLAYGLNRQPERELQTYLALMERYPGASRLSQATFHLREGDKDRARRVLDEALAQDESDGSLGSERVLAQHLRAIAGPKSPEAGSRPR